MSSETERVRETENLLGMLAPKPDAEVPTAGCPSCKAPLIATMAFSGAEFYCLECGRTCGWLSPYKLFGQEALDRQAALQAEWDEHAGGKLLPRGIFWQRDCEHCGGDHKPLPRGGHWEHVTDEEREADRVARQWLKERAAR